MFEAGPGEEERVRIVTTVALAMTGMMILTVLGTDSTVTAQTTAEPSRVSAYRVVYGTSPEDLVEVVTDALNDGWQPVGGLSADNGHYFQAIGK